MAADGDGTPSRTARRGRLAPPRRLPLPDREDQAAAGVQHDGVVAHAAADLLVHFAVDDHRPTGEVVLHLRVRHRDRQHEAFARRLINAVNGSKGSELIDTVLLIQ